MDCDLTCAARNTYGNAGFSIPRGLGLRPRAFNALDAGPSRARRLRGQSKAFAARHGAWLALAAFGDNLGGIVAGLTIPEGFQATTTVSSSSEFCKSSVPRRRKMPNEQEHPAKLSAAAVRPGRRRPARRLKSPACAHNTERPPNALSNDTVGLLPPLRSEARRLLTRGAIGFTYSWSRFSARCRPVCRPVRRSRAASARRHPDWLALAPCPASSSRLTCRGRA